MLELSAQFKVHCTILSRVSRPENYQHHTSCGKDTEELNESECRGRFKVNLELCIHNYKLKVIPDQ